MRASALTTTVATYYPLSLSVCLLSRSPNRLLVHQLLDIQEQTTITYALPLSLSLRPHLIIFRLGTERERTRQALGYPRCWNSIGETTSPARKSISA